MGRKMYADRLRARRTREELEAANIGAPRELEKAASKRSGARSGKGRFGLYLSDILMGLACPGVAGLGVDKQFGAAAADAGGAGPTLTFFLSVFKTIAVRLDASVARGGA